MVLVVGKTCVCGYGFEVVAVLYSLACVVDRSLIVVALAL
jgi:hypothetical protein